MKKQVKIDMRPHYTFAFYSEGMEFQTKTLLYYSRKEKALYYKLCASEIDKEFREMEDRELKQSISDDDAEVLERLFCSMVDAMKSYKGEPCFVCDGSENVVVCGKRRVRYEGPYLEKPFGAFESIVYRLHEMMKEDNSSALESIIKDVPQAIEVLKAGAGSA